MDHKFVDHKLLQDWVTVYVYVLRNMMLIWQAAYIYRKARPHDNNKNVYIYIYMTLFAKKFSPLDCGCPGVDASPQ